MSETIENLSNLEVEFEANDQQSISLLYIKVKVNILFVHLAYRVFMLGYCCVSQIVRKNNPLNLKVSFTFCSLQFLFKQIFFNYRINETCFSVNLVE